MRSSCRWSVRCRCIAPSPTPSPPHPRMLTSLPLLTFLQHRYARINHFPFADHFCSIVIVGFDMHLVHYRWVDFGPPSQPLAVNQGPGPVRPWTLGFIYGKDSMCCGLAGLPRYVSEGRSIFLEWRYSILVLTSADGLFFSTGRPFFSGWNARLDTAYWSIFFYLNFRWTLIFYLQFYVRVSVWNLGA